MQINKKEELKMSSRFKPLTIGSQLMTLASSIIAALRREQVKLRDTFADMLGEMPNRAVQYQPINDMPKSGQEFQHNS